MGSRDSLPSETYTISPFSREEMMGAWFFRTMNGPMVPGSVTEDTACSTDGPRQRHGGHRLLHKRPLGRYDMQFDYVCHFELAEKSLFLRRGQ